MARRTAYNSEMAIEDCIAGKTTQLDPDSHLKDNDFARSSSKSSADKDGMNGRFEAVRLPEIHRLEILTESAPNQSSGPISFHPWETSRR